MNTSFEILFWLAIGLLVYPHIGYPPLIRLLARLIPERRELPPPPADWPRVTLVISAYNEARVIARKLDNALVLDYPPNRLEIVVVSDASTDRTDTIVTEVAARDPRVRLLRQEQRLGKSAGLNKAVEQAGSDIIVFSDANAMYRADALKELVRGFSDPRVGYVVGAAHYTADQASAAAASEGVYWDQELRLKAAESRFYSVVGGDGAIYAIRRALFWDLRDDDISDFVNPLQVVAAGYRGIFNPAAVCTEDAGDAFEQEFRRKRRIVNRTWRAVRRYGGRLSWRSQSRFLFALLSHKVIRWFSLALLAIAAIANLGILVTGSSLFYVFTFIGIVASAVVAAYGAWLDGRGRTLPRLVYLPYYFYLVSWAALLGIWDEHRGIRHTTWDHIRKDDAS